MSSKKKKRNIYVAVAFAIFFAGILLYVFNGEENEYRALSTSGNKTHIVTLTKDGFEPEIIDITLGDIVEFRTERSEQFWPASNLHPSHTIYSEFDPRRTLEADEVWRFTFMREGRFEFHDHLKPNVTGVITAGSDVSSLCNEGDVSSKEQCWEEKVLYSLEKEGLSSAFDTVVELYGEDEGFAPICHSYVHLIGEEAYAIFSESGTLPQLPREVSYCGYGFFHGFMETLLFTTGDLDEARELCDEVDRQFSGDGVSGPASACYHGYGHGFTDGGDPRAWGSADAIVAPSLAFCESVVESDLQEYLCVSGVYNATELLSVESKYGLDELKEDPLGFCNRQKTEYRGACYTNMIPAVLRVVKNNVADAITYANKEMSDPDGLTVENYTNKNMYILSTMAEFMRLNLSNPAYREEGISICRSLPLGEQSSCVEGLSFGHMKYGNPDTMLEQFFSFCGDGMLTDGEHDSCYGYILSRLQIWYNKEESAEICRRVPEKISEKYCSL